MLVLEKISKSFNQRGVVLDDLNFKAQSGDSIAITGPSGSGKTTLMNLIGALDKPDSGSIIFNGMSIAGLSSDELALYRNRNIGFMFQEHLLLKHLTVKDNIMLPFLAGNISNEEYLVKEEYASFLMERTGILELKEKYPFQISGGEAQRATLVRALINKPSILLADEPTGSLDSKNAEILGQLMVDMNARFGIALIVATHSPGLASMMRIQLRIEDGKLK